MANFYSYFSSIHIPINAIILQELNKMPQTVLQGNVYDTQEPLKYQDLLT